MTSRFNIDSFKQQLNTQWLGQNFLYKETLESTNSYVKKISSEEISHGLVCLADNQTGGRGQYNRKWEVEPGVNLTVTLAFQPSTAERVHVLTLACALALLEVFRRYLDEQNQSWIKWPNDVKVNGKKIAGILTEAVFNGNRLNRLVIGMGINLNQNNFPGELKMSATSLGRETGQKVERELFLAELLNRVEYKYVLWHQRQPDLIKAINRNIRGHGQWVGMEINGESRRRQYKMLGVDEKGKLLMLNEDGGIESFSYEQIRIVTH